MKRSPLRKHGKSPMAKAKAKAWKLCSIFNRTKDIDSEGFGKCCSCGRRIHWKQGDAGHYKDGRNNSILFYDNGIHLQCKLCNGGLSRGFGSKGTPDIKENYKKFLIKKYGKKEVEKIEKLSREIKQFTIKELEQIVEKYKQ